MGARSGPLKPAGAACSRARSTPCRTAAPTSGQLLANFWTSPFRDFQTAAWEVVPPTFSAAGWGRAVAPSAAMPAWAARLRVRRPVVGQHP